VVTVVSRPPKVSNKLGNSRGTVAAAGSLRLHDLLPASEALSPVQQGWMLVLQLTHWPWP
jgi:hypothetical protein